MREGHGYIKCIKGDEDNPPECARAPYNDQIEHPLYYMEFVWANFFRERLPLAEPGRGPLCRALPYASACLPDELDALKAVLGQAMALAASDAARQAGMPGYNPSRRPPPDVDPLGCER